MIIDSKVGKKYVGMFKGRVISHLPDGYCKIWIPGIYPESWCGETSSELKDCYNNDLVGPKLPNAAPTFIPVGGKGTQGLFAMPAINTTVWCFFENDDPNFPVYIASSYGEKSVKPLNNMTDSTKSNMGSSDSEILRDVILQFGRGYIYFSPNERIEIGFKSSETDDDKRSSSGDPKIVLDKSGKISITSDYGVRISSPSFSGVKIQSGANSVTVNTAGVTARAYGIFSRIKLSSLWSTSIASWYGVNIQHGMAFYPGPLWALAQLAKKYVNSMILGALGLGLDATTVVLPNPELPPHISNDLIPRPSGGGVYLNPDSSK